MAKEGRAGRGGLAEREEEGKGEAAAGGRVLREALLRSTFRGAKGR